MSTQQNVMLVLVVQSVVMACVFFYVWKRRSGNRSVLDQLAGAVGGQMVAGEVAGDCGGVQYRCKYYPGDRNTAPYFKVQPDCLFNGEFCVVRETPQEAFFTRIGLDQKIQTGDSVFDAECFIMTNHPEFASACFSQPTDREAVRSILDSGFTEIRHDGKVLSAKWNNFRLAGEVDSEMVLRTVRSLVLISRNMQRVPPETESFGFPVWRLEKGVFPAIASVLAAAGFVLMIWTDVAYKPVQGWDLWRKSLLAGVPSLLLFLISSAWFLRGRSYSHRDLGFVAAVSLVGFPMSFYGAEGVFNGSQDTRPAATHLVEVVDKYMTHSRSSTTYHVDVASWRRGRSTESLTVSRSFYGELVPGRSRLNIRTGPGALECEWICSVASVDQIAVPVQNSYAAVLADVPLTVERAFQAMGVPHLPFDPAPDMDSAEADFLQRFFGSIDAAVVARVQAMSAIEHSRKADDPIQEYRRAEEAV